MPMPAKYQVMKLIRDRRAIINAQRFPECFDGTGTNSVFIGFEKFSYRFSDKIIHDIAVILTAFEWAESRSALVTSSVGGHQHSTATSGLASGGHAQFLERALYDLHYYYQVMYGASAYNTQMSRVTNLVLTTGILAGPAPPNSIIVS